jgi:hypothetical protein
LQGDFANRPATRTAMHKTLYAVSKMAYGILKTLYGILKTLYGILKTLYSILKTLYGIFEYTQQYVSRAVGGCGGPDRIRLLWAIYKTCGEHGRTIALRSVKLTF